MRLDPNTLGDLAVRFASPHDAFKVIYAAESLATALAETVGVEVVVDMANPFHITPS